MELQSQQHCYFVLPFEEDSPFSYESLHRSSYVPWELASPLPRGSKVSFIPSVSGMRYSPRKVTRSVSSGPLATRVSGCVWNERQWPTGGCEQDPSSNRVSIIMMGSLQLSSKHQCVYKLHTTQNLFTISHSHFNNVSITTCKVLS